MLRRVAKMPKRAQLAVTYTQLFLLLSICWFATQPLPQKPHSMPGKVQAQTETDRQIEIQAETERDKERETLALLNLKPIRFVCIKWRLAKLSTSWNLNNAQKPAASKYRKCSSVQVLQVELQRVPSTHVNTAKRFSQHTESWVEKQP